ncbi:hypothetical protein ACJJTC_017723 [Scirpophaga incertulas]
MPVTNSCEELEDNKFLCSDENIPHYKNETCMEQYNIQIKELKIQKIYSNKWMLFSKNNQIITTSLQFKETSTPPSQLSSRDTSRNTTPRGSAKSSRQSSRQTSSERPADAPPTVQEASTHTMLKKTFSSLKPMERSASLQNVATTSYATIAGSPQVPRDPRLRTRSQKTPENPRGPFDKAHRSPVKTPEAPKPFCRPPKRQQDPDDEPNMTGRSIRQKIEDVAGAKPRRPKKKRRPTTSTAQPDAIQEPEQPVESAKPTIPAHSGKLVKAPHYVRNIIHRDLKIDTIREHTIQLARKMYERASRSVHPLIKDIAPQHARPPEGRRKKLPRDLLENTTG